MSNKIEQLTAEVTELSLKLQREVVPEKTEVKLQKQIEALQTELAANSSESSVKVEERNIDKVKVLSERSGLLVLQTNKSEDETRYGVKPGVNNLSKEQAELAIKYDQVKLYEAT